MRACVIYWIYRNKNFSRINKQMLNYAHYEQILKSRDCKCLANSHLLNLKFAKNIGMMVKNTGHFHIQS